MFDKIKLIRNGKSKETYLQFYKIMAIPVFFYGSENWITKTQDKQLKNAEMWLYLIITAGNTLRYSRRCKEVLK